MSGPARTTVPASPKPRRLEEMWAGLALFFSMYYILVLNPEILHDKLGIPASAVLLGTFLIIIVFNFTGALVTGTGLLIAPAVGMTVFFSDFILAIQKQNPNVDIFDWRHAMLGCLVAGIFLIAVSFGDLRSRIVEDLPPSVRQGATAAIGSLLAFEAFDEYRIRFVAPRGLIDGRFAIVTVGISLLIFISFMRLRRSVEPELGAGWRNELTRAMLRSEFFLVSAGITGALHLFEPAYVRSLPREPLALHAWIWSNARLSNLPFGANTIFLTAVFAAIVWFIIVTDIPGTPNMVLPAATTQDQARKEIAVRRGYLNDAVAALASPIAGTTPTIFYAENNLLKDFKIYSPGVGWWATAVFALLFAAMMATGIPLQSIIPAFAVMPILLFIGLYVIAVSFLGEDREAVLPDRGPEFYLPAAIAVILTPQIGLEYSFPLSILSHWFVGGDPGGPTFRWVKVGALASLFVFAVVNAFNK